MMIRGGNNEWGSLLGSESGFSVVSVDYAGFVLGDDVLFLPHGVSPESGACVNLLQSLESLRQVG